ncbi:MAG TPA: hypothetical protein VK436_16770 [Methanocella sp.]|nr:hypothetical protein [Methanocella sp.]
MPGEMSLAIVDGELVDLFNAQGLLSSRPATSLSASSSLRPGIMASRSSPLMR